MMNHFLLMGQDPDLRYQLCQLGKQAHWSFEQVTTPTGLVVALEKQQPAGVWWELSATNLDTTIATMTLIRHQVFGPITVFVPNLTDQIQQKLYRAQVDDIVAFPFTVAVLRSQLEQRLGLYQHIQFRPTVAPRRQSTRQLTTIGQWQIDRQNYTVTKNGVHIDLTPKEFQLLSYLVDHRDQVLSRDQLITGVWGYDMLNTSRIVDIHISHLRDKLEDDPHRPTHLLTVRGFGYKIVE